ncbi:hypothetical protein LY76DRAFT_146116 [Colletotrichum caudatum]|nr:hypothetical protein LY76DRAFT_146116 [Colletotrichum caudatum]
MDGLGYLDIGGEEGVVLDMRRQRNSRHTHDQRSPSMPSTNATTIRSPYSELLWIALSRPEAFPHEARQPVPIRRHWGPTRQGAPGEALRATTATSSLGWAWAKTMPGSQEKMAFCLSMERAGGAEAPCGADEPNCKELAHTPPPLSSHGVLLNRLAFSKHPGPIHTVGSGTLMLQKRKEKDFSPS